MKELWVPIDEFPTYHQALRRGTPTAGIYLEEVIS